jgi:hypothetical protein
MLWLVLGYVVWKIVQIVLRSIGNSRPRNDVLGEQPPSKSPPKKFSNVEDADFEDLPPDGKR